MGAVPVSEDESNDPRRSSYGRAYWLRRCEGFLVETPTRRIGRVDGIRYGDNPDEPEALVIYQATLAGLRPAITLRHASSSVAPVATATGAPCVLAWLGSRDPQYQQHCLTDH